MNEYSGTKQRGRICAFNMLMCAVVIGLAGTLGAGTVTRASLQRAIDAAAARGGGKITVPAGGHFMEGPLHLRSNVELALADGAELVFTDDPKAYLPAVDTTWEAVECRNYSPLIYAYGCTNVALTGKGTLRAKMDLWRKWFARPPAHMAFTRQLYEWGSHDVPLAERDATKIPGSNARPQFVQFNRCKGVRLEDFRIRESPFWCVHLYQSEDCTVRGLDICARGHNNDGIDIDMTRNVLIENCTLDQGDDAFVVKSGRNRDGWRINRSTENVEIRNCRVIHGHTLLGIGSDLSAGIRGVRIHDCTVEDSVFRAFYIKTSRRRGGEISDIVMDNCRVKATTDAIVAIDTDVLYQFRNLPTYDERLTDIHDIAIHNVTCEQTPHLVRLAGDAACPLREIMIEGVTAKTVTKTPVVLANCVGVSVNGKGVDRSDFGSILARPVLPQTAWMSSDRASRQPFGDRTGLTRREVSASSAGPLRIERAAYAHANGLELPAVEIVPQEATGEPVVITGQSNRVLRKDYLGWALGGKRPVIAIDLFGTGEIAGCLENGKDADAETTLAARLKARGESLEAIRAAELAFVLGEAKRRFGKPATVLAGSATYAAAERAAREHPELVGRLIRAQGEKTVLPQ